MEEEIIRIARENISNRKKGGIAAIISVLIFCIFFAYSVETNFQYTISILGFVISPIIGILIASHYSKKIIGKRTALDQEVERLKALHPQEKLRLPEIDNAELKLREMIHKNSQDDMV